MMRKVKVVEVKEFKKKMLKSPHNLSKGHRIQDGVIRKVRNYETESESHLTTLQRDGEDKIATTPGRLSALQFKSSLLNSRPNNSDC